MKKFYFLTGLIALLTALEGHGVENMKNKNYNYGTQRYGSETLSSIQTNGAVILEGTKILGLAEINGSLQAEEAAMNSLQINGQVDLKNCFVPNGSNINGMLNADNTKFLKELSVSSQKITLRTCAVDSLIIREVAGFKGVQILDLRDGTTITGPIVVESGNGEVWLSTNSEVSGEVTGAKVIKK